MHLCQVTGITNAFAMHHFSQCKTMFGSPCHIPRIRGYSIWENIILYYYSLGHFRNVANIFFVDIDKE